MKLEILVENLQAQISLHEELLDILTRETELPTNCSLEVLAELQNAKDQVVQSIYQKEDDRIKMVQQYCDHEQLVDGSLSRIIEVCDDEFQSELIHCKRTLLELIEEVKEVGQKSALIANARLQSIVGMQNAIHRVFHRQPLYSQKGKVSQPRGACLVRKSV
ncbi:MAG: hypothetical protein ACI86H_000606 [bacterium]|jgi:hypothetical protein